MSMIIVGAGPGLGHAIARQFAAHGMPVGLIARNVERLSDLKEKLERSSASVAIASADASDPAALRGAIDQLSSQLGAPSVLVYNAAVSARGKPSELDAATLMKELQVDVVGALVAANHVAPGMITAGAGTILFTGGGYADRPWPGMAGLGIGKAALRNLARCMAQEYGDQGVHVATVTIHGMVRDETPFAPATIAKIYSDLHNEARGHWRTEVDFRG